MQPNSQQGWIGVDVGASCVKVAQVSLKDGRLHLDHAAITPRRESNADATAQAASVRYEIEGALATIGTLNTKRCAGMLSMSECDVTPGKPTDAGVKAAGGCVDTWLAESTPREEHWYTFTASHDAAEGLANDLLDAGLSCRTIDAGTHALARAAAWASPGKRGDVLGVLDWGYSGAMYCSVLNGCPVYVRQLKEVALRELEDTLIAELDVNRTEAYRLLSGVATDENRDFAELVGELAKPLAARLADELTKTLEHLRSHRTTVAPREVVVFGGGGALGLERVIGPRIGCPVRAWKLPGDGAAAGVPACLLGPAVALSALAWEGR
ncbi:MAG: hypothetical protein AAF589_08100 [Planctomycetota bacterium]